MKYSIAKVLWCLLVLFSLQSVNSLVFGGALVHASLEGKIVVVNEYKDHTVRVTVQNHAWPNERHYIVIKSTTKIYRDGNPSKHLTPSSLHKGDTIKAEGGVTTFGNRIVADKIIILK